MIKQNKKHIYFRTDANSDIGFGHLIRSIALCNILKDSFHCKFIILNSSLDAINIIKNEKIKFINISKEEDIITEITKEDILVLDKYNFDFSYQKNFYNHCFKLVCIDDICDRDFFCDVIINHSEGISENDYTNKIKAKYFLGIKYSLLRKEFLNIKNEPNQKNNLESCFICFGGSDNENYTLDTLTKITTIKSIKEINIVIGGGYKFEKDLVNSAKKFTDIKINISRNVNTDKMLKIIQKSDFAIAPSSSISYELIALNKPLITGITIENQSKIYNSLVSKNIAIGINQFPINNIDYAFNKLIENFNSLKQNQGEIFDGNTITRLKNIFLNL